MPKHWLVKSEPEVYNIEDLARDRTTFWNGVRSYGARIHLQAMRKGDLTLFYHSNAEPSGVVGIARVVGEARPDPTQFDKKRGEEMGYDPKSTPDAPRWFGVDVEFVEKLPRLVSLAEIKAKSTLKEMALLKISRLSVCPVRPEEWKIILAMARKA